MPTLDSDILVRPNRGRAITVKDSPKLQRFAMRWSYIARYRRRWTSSASSEERLDGRIRGELAEIGITDDRVRKLGEASLIEVAVPWERESVGWAPRILPWEFVLATATAPYREGPVLIVRRLVKPPRRGRVKASPRARRGSRSASGSSRRQLGWRMSSPSMRSAASSRTRSPGSRWRPTYPRRRRRRGSRRT